MANIKDVARQAEVSVSTVSHVINGTRFVSPELRERVFNAIEQLNYRPNALARGLRMNETHTLGLLVPDNANPFFGEVAKGAEDAGFSHGYSVILCNSDNTLEKELRYIDVLLSKSVDGIILISVTLHAEHLESITRSGTPLVVVDRELEGIEGDVVLSDNLAGGYQATQHLVDLGHRRIACITGPSGVTPSAERVRGYREALRDNNLEVDEGLIAKGDFHLQAGVLAADKLMSLADPPSAIFACNDAMAIGTLHRLQERGKEVPREISIVGFDDIGLASYVAPPLTTIFQPKYEMGRQAVEILIDRLAGRYTGPPKRIMLDTELVIRGSSAVLEATG